MRGTALRENLRKKIACIVLPTYNERENLRQLLPLIFDESHKIPTHELHVLVVDDESPDGTADCVRSAMATQPHLHLITGQKRGLGEAYKRGISYAIGLLAPELILQMDADFQHDPGLLPQFIARCDEGYDLVIGSRFCRRGDLDDFPWHRRLMSSLGTKLVRWFAGIPPISDCTSGYRCIRAGLIAECDFGPHSTRGYSFQSWFLCELLRHGARYAEIPLRFPARAHGESKLSLNDKIEFLQCLSELARARRASMAYSVALRKREASHAGALPMRALTHTHK
jgi:dolichol-phosphate mannosyltransferase